MEGGCDGGVIRSGGIGILLVIQPGGEVGRGFGGARFGVQLGQGRFGGLSCGLLRGLGFFGPAGLFGFGGLGLLRIGLVRSRGGGAAEEDDGGAKGAGGRGGVCRCES